MNYSALFIMLFASLKQNVFKQTFCFNVCYFMKSRRKNVLDVTNFFYKLVFHKFFWSFMYIHISEELPCSSILFNPEFSNTFIDVHMFLYQFSSPHHFKCTLRIYTHVFVHQHIY